MAKLKEKDLKMIKKEVNEKHLKFYDKSLNILEFILDEYSRELTRADIEFLDMPKNSVAVFDFLVSTLIKIQKGQRLALGMDDEVIENIEPEINIIEGVNKDKL